MMTALDTISTIFVKIQSDCDVIIRAGGSEKRLAEISFLTCDVLLALCEEPTPHTEDVIDSISKVFSSLAEESQKLGGENGALLAESNFACEAASRDLAQLLASKFNRTTPL